MKDSMPGHNAVGRMLFYAFALSSSTLLLLVQLFGAGLFQTKLTLVFLLIAGLGWWRLGGIVVLLAVQIYLLLSEPIGNEFRFEWSCIFIPILTIVLVALVERTHAISRMHGNAGWPQRFKAWRLALVTASQAFSRQACRSIVSLIIGILISVVITIGVLGAVPLDRTAVNWVRLRPTELRGIVLAAVLVGTFLLGSTVIGELKWRRVTLGQARLFLRGSVANWIEAEWRAVARKRIKAQRAVRKTSLDTTPRALKAASTKTHR